MVLIDEYDKPLLDVLDTGYKGLQNGQAFTSLSLVNTSPCCCTRSRDFTCFAFGVSIKIPDDSKQKHPTIIWHYIYNVYDTTTDTDIEKGCKLLLTVFRGTSLGIFWTPSANKNNAYTHCWVQTSSILIRGLAKIPDACIYAISQPSLMWSFIQIISFLGLFSGTPQ